MNAIRSNGFNVSLLAFCCAALSLALSPSRSAAAPIQSTITMCSDYGWAQSPSSGTAQATAQNKTAAAASTSFNNPILEFTNTSLTANVTDIKMTVMDPTTVIDALKILSAPAGANAAAPFATAVWGGTTKTIDIKLPNPLTPNSTMYFTLNLAAASGFANTWTGGFQNLLWKANAPGVNTNANVSVTYVDPAHGNAQTVLTQQLTNDPTKYFAQNLISSCCTGNVTAATMLSGVLAGPSVATPEPPAMVLMALGSISLGICHWRRKRKAALHNQAAATA